MTTDALGQAGAPVGAGLGSVVTVAYAVVAHPISVAFAESVAGNPFTVGVLTAVALPVVMASTARAVVVVTVLTRLVTAWTAVGTATMTISIAPGGRPAITITG